MVAKRRWGAAETTVKINAKSYVLVTVGGQPVFSSGTRAIEGVPTDNDQISWSDFSAGLGRAFYTSLDLMTSVEGVVSPRPTVTSLTLTTAPVAPLRFGFEAQDAGGTWYRYFISPRSIVKVDLSAATPVYRSTIGPAHGPTAPFLAADRLGQPEYIYSARAGGYRWMVGCNSGTRMCVLDTVGIGAAADTWTKVDVTSGMAHMEQLASGKVMRSFADAGNPGIAKVSLLTAGADGEIAANWGGGFVVDSEGYRILSLLAFDELVYVEKQNGWFSAVELGDGTLQWRTRTPDFPFAEVVAIGSESFQQGCVWHGKAWLPTAVAFFRDTGLSSLPVGPDSVPGNTAMDWRGDQINTPLRFGVVPTAISVGAWLYLSYRSTVGESALSFLVTVRDGQGAEEEIVSHPLLTEVDAINGLWRQVNGVGAPRVWYSPGTTLKYFNVALDGNPFRGFLDSVADSPTYGQASTGSRLLLNDALFPSTVLLREVQLVLEFGVADITWGIRQYRDGGSADAVGTAITATGSIFWTAGSSDEARRVRLEIVCTQGAGYVPLRLPPRLLKSTLFFTYLPDVSDTLAFTIDVAATAQRRRVSEQAVYDELKAYRSTRQAWVDPYGNSGQVHIASTQQTPPKRLAGALEGRQIISVQGQLLEYS